MANFKKTTVAGPRTELHETLGLTGCEASYNVMAAGSVVPFVHAHKKNEELYIVLKGSGELYLDGEITELKYICVQAQQGSLEGFTMSDGIICEGEKAF